MEYDVLIIGGGASGMMAAIAAAQSSASVCLVDKNEKLGVKLSITGGGRCNILNFEENERTLLEHYGESSKFLYSAFARFGMHDTVHFFTDLGVPIKVEARNRAFPVSESASDVVEALTKQLNKLKVDVKVDTTITGFKQNMNSIVSAETHGEAIRAKQYILATGGTSRPETGATGDGFNWLSSLGHTVKAPSPDITPLTTDDVPVEMAGLRLKDTSVNFYVDTKKQFASNGDILFTHSGISGPAVLNASQKVGDLLSSGEEVFAKIDCLPEQNEKELDELLINTFAQHPKKQLKQALRLVLPASLVAGMIAGSPDIDFIKKTSEVSKETRSKIVNQTKSFTVCISGLMGLEKAVVADGGVELTELDTRSMKSLKVSNLFITGDLLNIKRPSGGYSLQLCWTTGYVAGMSAAEATK